MTFGALDYVVVAAVLLVSIGIGLYVRCTGNRQKSNDEFILANRSMTVLPVAFSLMASFMSSITLLGVSSEIYMFGIQFIVINFAYLIATPIAANLFLPVFYKLQAASAYEYLECRFGKLARLSASLAYSLQMILYMGIVVYAPALALESAVGIDKELAIIIIGITVIIYCCIGGIKAVLLTDVFQSILMFVAVFLVIISGINYAGGIGNIIEEAKKGGRWELLNFNPDPTERHSWFSLIIGGMFTYLSLYAVNQTQVQRLMTVKSLKGAQRALWWSWPILLLLSITTSFSGLVIYYYYRNCDPLLAKRITSRDQMMPIYIMDVLGHIPGITGLFVAGVFSATLSTVSSCLNSLAAVTLEDYFKPMYKFVSKKELQVDESRSAVPTKIIAGIYGFICIGTAFLAEKFGGILQISLTIFGAVGGPLLALFTLGMSFLSPNEYGSVIGLFSGVLTSLVIGFADKPTAIPLQVNLEDCSQFNIYNLTRIIPQAASTRSSEEYFYLFRLSYWYTVVIGFFITFFVGYFASVILKAMNYHGTDKVYIDGNKNLINYDLFMPPIAARLKEQRMKKGHLITNIALESITKL
ncbi:hypothetical protein ACKWTF_010212 [Chironomus riparius]